MSSGNEKGNVYSMFRRATTFEYRTFKSDSDNLLTILPLLSIFSKCVLQDKSESPAKIYSAVFYRSESEEVSKNFERIGSKNVLIGMIKLLRKRTSNFFQVIRSSIRKVAVAPAVVACILCFATATPLIRALKLAGRSIAYLYQPIRQIFKQWALVPILTLLQLGLAGVPSAFAQDPVLTINTEPIIEHERNDSLNTVRISGTISEMPTDSIQFRWKTGKMGDTALSEYANRFTKPGAYDYKKQTATVPVTIYPSDVESTSGCNAVPSASDCQHTFSTNLQIAIYDDRYYEGEETFTIVLSDLSGATFPNDAMTLDIPVKITDSESAPRLYFGRIVDSDELGSNGGMLAKIEVLVRPLSVVDHWFSFETVDGSAVGGTDFTNTADPSKDVGPGTDYKISAGTSGQFIFVEHLVNSSRPPDARYSVRLVAPSNSQNSLNDATLTSQSKTVAFNAPALTVHNYVYLRPVYKDFMNENDGRVDLRFYMSKAPTQDISFDYELSGTATKDTDYSVIEVAGEVTATTITLPSSKQFGTSTYGGQQYSIIPHAVFPVSLTDDDVYEGNETITITLSNPQNVRFPGGRTEYTETFILRDEDTAKLEFDDTSITMTEDQIGQMLKVGLVGSDSISKSVDLEFDVGLEASEIDGNEIADTATPDSDYVAKNPVYNANPSRANLNSITIDALEDSLQEGDETLTVRIFERGNDPRQEDYVAKNPDDPDYFDIFDGDGEAIAKITILDRNTPKISIENTNGVFVDSVISVNRNQPAEFYLILDRILVEDLVVPVTINTKTYLGTEGRTVTRNITIPAFASTMKFSVPFVEDPDFYDKSEIDGSITVEIQPSDEYSIMREVQDAKTYSRAAAIVFVKRFDLSGYDIRLSIEDAEIHEGQAGQVSRLMFPVRLSRPAPRDVTFTWSLTNGTATATTESTTGDFDPPTGTSMRIPAGTTVVEIPVVVNGDRVFEGHETFTLTLANVVGATLLDGEATGTIREDDGLGIAIEDATVVEGSGMMTFKLTTTDAHWVNDMTVQWETEGLTATAGSDYTERTRESETLHFITGEDLIQVPIANDTMAEANETFKVKLTYTAAGQFDEYYFIRSEAIGTIIDNDQSLSISDASQSEGSAIDPGQMEFKVSLSETVDADVTFDWSTTHGTAGAGTDFIAVSSTTATIPKGESEAVLTVYLVGDSEAESNEAFTVTIRNATNAMISDGTATGTIINDEGPSMRIADATLMEGDSGESQMMFLVTMSEAHSTDVNVTYETILNGSAGNSDITTVSSGTASIPAGNLTVLLPVTVTGDITVELDETFILKMSVSQSDVWIVDDEATGTIIDNEGADKVAIIGGPPIMEGDEAWFQISAVKPSSTDRTIRFHINDEDANNFTSTAGDICRTYETVTLKAYNIRTIYRRTTVEDEDSEQNGYVIATLCPSTEYVYSDSQRSARVRVLNDDLYDLDGLSDVSTRVDIENVPEKGPIVSLIPVVPYNKDKNRYELEEGRTLTFKFVSNPAPSSDLEVHYTVDDEFLQKLRDYETKYISGTEETIYGTLPPWLSDEDMRTERLSGKVTIRAGRSEKVIRWKSLEDNYRTGDGEITITMKDSQPGHSPYRLDESDNGKYKSATVHVLDNEPDPIPELSIKAIRPEVNLGEVVQFRIENSAYGFNAATKDLPEKTLRINLCDLREATARGIDRAYNGNALLNRGTSIRYLHLDKWTDYKVPAFAPNWLQTNRVEMGEFDGSTDLIAFTRKPLDFILDTDLHQFNIKNTDFLEVELCLKGNHDGDPEYRIAPGGENAKVRIKIRPQIEIEAVSGTYTEGDDLVFKLKSNLIMTEPVDVHYKLKQTGNFLNVFGNAKGPNYLGISWDANTVTFPGNGQREYEVRVATVDDNVVEADGSVTVQLSEDDAMVSLPDYVACGVLYHNNSARNYRIHPQCEATLNVTNNDSETNEPTFMLETSQTGNLTEGSPFSLTLKPIATSTTPTKPVEVQLTVTETSDFLDSWFRSSGRRLAQHPRDGVVNLNEGTHWVHYAYDSSDPDLNINILTVDDGTYDADGTVTVTLADGTGYTVDSNNNDVTANYVDNDAASGNPTVSVAFAESRYPTGAVDTKDSTVIERFRTGTMTEGDHFVFNLTLSQEAHSDITVNIDITGSGDFFTKNINADHYTLGSSEIFIPAGETTMEIVVPTKDDNDLDMNGNVVVTVAAGTGYRESATPATAVINDNDSTGVPEISLHSNFTAMFAGNANIMELRSSVPVNADLEVDISITGTGNFFYADEAALNADHSTAESTDLWIGNHTLTIKSIINNTGAPLTVPVKDNGRSVRFRILTKDDTSQVDSTLTVTVNTGSGYVVHPVFGERSVTVINSTKDLSTVSLDHELKKDTAGLPFLSMTIIDPLTNQNGYPKFREGKGNDGMDGPILFTLSSTKALAEDLLVRIFVSEVGDYICLPADCHRDMSLGYRTVTLKAGETSMTVPVRTVNDQVKEPDGSISVRIVDGTGYLIAVESAQAFVSDDETGSDFGLLVESVNDYYIELSISDAEVIEGTGTGGSVDFKVSATDNQSLAFAVSWLVTSVSTDADDFLNRSSQSFMGSLDFGVSTGETALMETISIPIMEDDKEERDETFTIKLIGVSGAGADVVRIAQSPHNIATGTILNDDGIAVSITSAKGSEDDGSGNNGTVDFIVTATDTQSTKFTVNYTIKSVTANANDFASISALPYTTGTIEFDLTNGATSMMETISVPIKADFNKEPDETFNIILTSVMEGTSTSATVVIDSDGNIATGTIENNDGVAVSIESATGTEGTRTDGSVNFTVTATDTQYSAFTVNYRIIAGTAEATDFKNINSFPFIGAISFEASHGTGSDETSLTEIISVPLMKDSDRESDETFTIELTGVTEYSMSSSAVIVDSNGYSATGTILNDDGALLSIADATGTEGTSSDGVIDFTVTATNSIAQSFAITWSVTAVTAETGEPADADDFNFANQSAFPFTGETSFMHFGGKTPTSKTISIPIAMDAAKEPDEFFIITLTGATKDGSLAPTTGSNSVQIAMTGNSAIGEILNDDGAIVSIENAEGEEGTSADGKVDFTVSATDNLTQSFTIEYTVSGISADADDFLSHSTATFDDTVLFAIESGETNLTETISILISKDADREKDETFTVTLNSVTGDAAASVAIGKDSKNSAEGTILNDDGIAVSITNAKDVEDDGSVDFTVSANDSQSQAFAVAWSVSSASMDADDFLNQSKLPFSGVLDFATTSGETALSEIISIPIMEDDEKEGDETFTITLTGVSGSGADSVTISSLPHNRATGTVLNDDGILLSIADAEALEGTGTDKSIRFTVIATDDQETGFTVVYSISGDTADANDFVNQSSLPFSSTVNFATIAGETALEETIYVPIATDGQEESDETFTITLTDVSGSGADSVTIAPAPNNSAVGTILNDDGVLVSIEDAEVEEGTGTESTINFTVSATDNQSQKFAVTWLLEGMSVDSNDFLNLNVLPFSGSVDFNLSNGETSLREILSIPIMTDAYEERDETFKITLTGVTGAGAGSVAIAPKPGNMATGTILNDDGILLSISNAEGFEGTGTNGSVDFTVSATDNQSQVYAVSWSIASVSADADDFLNQSNLPFTGSLDFGTSTGETALKETISIPIMEDDEKEDDETFTITLTGVTGVGAGSVSIATDSGNMATGTILNDDGIFLSISDAEGFEGTGTNGSVDFTVSATDSQSQAYAVSWSVFSVTADAEDFLNQSNLPYAGSLDFGTSTGETALTETISITIMEDDEKESDETFTITLTGVSGAGADSVVIAPSPNNFATGTILNDDGIAVSIKNAKGVEDDSAGNDGIIDFTIVATDTQSTKFTVNYTISGETADATDFASISALPYTAGAIEFGLRDGETTLMKTISIPIEADTNKEADETFTIKLTGVTEGVSTSANVVIDSDGNSATGTIENNDGVAVRIESAIGTEGTGADGEVVFTVEATDTQTTAFKVNYRITAGTADEKDFLTISSFPFTGAINFNATYGKSFSETRLTEKISIPIMKDSDRESKETFTIELTGVTENSLPSPTVTVDSTSERATGTILNDDGVIVSLVGDVEVVEGTSTNGVVDFIIETTDNLTEAFTVNWRIDGITANADDFFNQSSESFNGTTSFLLSEGETSTTETQSIQIMADDESEVDETFTMTLTSISGIGATSATIASAPDNRAKGTILNDDGVSVSIARSSGVEGTGANGSVDFTVMATDTQSKEFAVTWEVVAGTADSSDFLNRDTLPFTGSVSFNLTDGETAMSEVIAIPIVGDIDKEPDETFTITLNGVIGDGASSVSIAEFPKNSAEGMITNDDGVEVSIDHASGDEGTDSDGLVVFVVTASDTQSQTFAVGWELTIGTADVSDFLNQRTLPFTGFVAFNLTDGETALTENISIPIKADNNGESDETFTITLTSVASVGAESVTVAQSPKNSAIGTITNDDGVVVSIKDASGIEGTDIDGKVVFAVKATDTQSRPFAVFWSISAGTADSIDFFNQNTLPFKGSVDFNLTSGETELSEYITIPIMADDVAEVDDTFTITLAGVTGDGADSVTLAEAPYNSAEGTIVNDDGPLIEEINIEAGNSFGARTSIEEGQDAVFTISSNKSSSDTVVSISVAQTRSHIFVPLPKTVILDEGSYELVIPTTDNSEDDPNNGAIIVTLIDTDDYEIPNLPSNQSARVVVKDNDEPTGEKKTRYSVAASVITSILLGIGETSQSAPVDSLPVVSISADTISIEEGSAAQFTIFTLWEVESEITVFVELKQSGDFLTGSVQRSVLLNKGSRSALITVQTQDDNNAERDGTIEAEIKEGKDYVVGDVTKATVNVSDAGDRQKRRDLIGKASYNIMSHTLGLKASHLLGTTTDRLDQAFAEGGDLSIELGGNSTLAELLHEGIQSMDKGMKSWQDVLGDSSFEIGLFPEVGAANIATFWGVGNSESISDEDALDGEHFSGHFGFDAAASKGVVAGLSTSITRFDLEYEIGNSVLTYQTSSTGLHPYVGLEMPNGGRLQVIAGYGQGEIELNQDGYVTEILDSSFINIGIGGEVTLYSNANILKGGTSDLSINGESWMASQFVSGGSDAVSSMRSNGRHLMLSAVGTHDRKLENGAKVIPEISIGLRENGMKQQSLLGMQIGGGLGYTNLDGYRISSKGEFLLSDVSAVQEWGVSGLLAYDLLGDRLGVLVDISPAWGQSVPTKDSALWGRSVLNHEFDSEVYTNGAKVDAEFGYGINIWQGSGVFTPFTRVELTQGNDDAFHLGSSLKIGFDTELELGISHSSLNDGSAESEISLKSDLKW